MTRHRHIETLFLLWALALAALVYRASGGDLLAYLDMVRTRVGATLGSTK